MRICKSSKYLTKVETFTVKIWHTCQQKYSIISHVFLLCVCVYCSRNTAVTPRTLRRNEEWWTSHNPMIMRFSLSPNLSVDHLALHQLCVEKSSGQCTSHISSHLTVWAYRNTNRKELQIQEAQYRNFLYYYLCSGFFILHKYVS